MTDQDKAGCGLRSTLLRCWEGRQARNVVYPWRTMPKPKTCPGNRDSPIARPMIVVWALTVDGELGE